MKDSSARGESRRISGPARLGRVLSIIGAVLSAAVLVPIGVGRFEPGVKGEWQWRYAPTGRGAEVWSPLLAALVFLALLYVCWRAWRALPRSRAAAVVVVCALAFGHLVLQMNVAYLGKLGARDFAAVTMCPWSNGYWFEARGVKSPLRMLRAYPRLMSALGDHSRTHPPGPIVCFWLINRWAAAHAEFAKSALDALEDTSFAPRAPVARLGIALRTKFSDAETFAGWVASLLMVGAYTASIVLVYLLARILHGRDSAFLAAVLCCALPAPLFFAPCLDASYAVFTLGSMTLYCWGVERRRIGPLVAAGAVAGCGLTMTLGVAPVFGIALLYSSFRSGKRGGNSSETRRTPWRIASALRPFGWFVVGVLGVFAAAQALVGLNMFVVAAKLLSLAPQSMRDEFCGKQSTMTYWKWIFWNVANFFIFIGLPMAVLYIGGLASDAGRGRLLHRWNRGGSFHLSFLLALLILNFSGVTLGEVARLWLPYMPFVAIRVAAGMRGLRLAGGPSLYILVLLQYAHAVVFKLSFSWI